MDGVYLGDGVFARVNGTSIELSTQWGDEEPAEKAPTVSLSLSALECFLQFLRGI
jgi:hypothetical protein